MINIIKNIFKFLYMGFWLIVSIPLNIFMYFFHRKNFKNGQPIYTIKRHDKIKAIKSIKVNAKAYLEAPKTVKFTCMIPRNTILISQWDYLRTQKEIFVRPENYDEYEQNCIPENIKNNEKYASYELFIYQEDIGSKYTIIQSAVKKDTFEKTRRKGIIKVGTRLKLYGGYDNCAWLCGREYYKGTVIRTVNTHIKNDENEISYSNGYQVNLKAQSFCIVKLNYEIHFEEMTSDIIRISLRFVGANWGGDTSRDDVIAVYLCPDIDNVLKKTRVNILNHMQFMILLQINA